MKLVLAENRSRPLYNKLSVIRLNINENEQNWPNILYVAVHRVHWEEFFISLEHRSSNVSKMRDFGNNGLVPSIVDAGLSHTSMMY